MLPQPRHPSNPLFHAPIHTIFLFNTTRFIPLRPHPIFSSCYLALSTPPPKDPLKASMKVLASLIHVYEIMQSLATIPNTHFPLFTPTAVAHPLSPLPCIHPWLRQTHISTPLFPCSASKDKPTIWLSLRFINPPSCSSFLFHVLNNLLVVKSTAIQFKVMIHDSFVIVAVYDPKLMNRVVENLSNSSIVGLTWKSDLQGIVKILPSELISGFHVFVLEYGHSSTLQSSLIFPAGIIWCTRGYSWGFFSKLPSVIIYRTTAAEGMVESHTLCIIRTGILIYELSRWLIWDVIIMLKVRISSQGGNFCWWWKGWSFILWKWAWWWGFPIKAHWSEAFDNGKILLNDVPLAEISHEHPHIKNSIVSSEIAIPKLLHEKEHSYRYENEAKDRYLAKFRIWLFSCGSVGNVCLWPWPSFLSRSVWFHLKRVSLRSLLLVPQWHPRFWKMKKILMSLLLWWKIQWIW